MNRLLPILSVLMMSGAIAAAQSANEPADPPSGEPLPSLDELLGLEEGDDSGVDREAEELREVLSPREAGEALGQAVNLMERVASRIEEGDDLSLSTQRLQEDILRKLDQVIESAQNNQQSGGGSSSSQSSSSSSQQQPNQQQQEGQSQQQGQEGDGSGQEQMPGGSSNAQPGGEVAPNGVSWGALPQRVRDALSQGISDRYSELYRSITEQYYRALAEDEDQ